MHQEFWKGKRVLVTGHTGFKGGWLSLWLRSLGADVFGVALPPLTSPNFFEVADIGGVVHSHMVDIRDLGALRARVKEIRPECAFHLAAQPLVRLSYQDPVGTFSTNVLGTVHVLEALREVSSLLSAVVVTSDKCYENREWAWGYRESDPMGGHDPYSGSKGCTELVTASYGHSFFQGTDAARIATARAGNVIGGGDWSPDRLVPDVLRSFSEGKPVVLRYPEAIRPWQHVLEPLGGYLELARQLATGAQKGGGGWNFGPKESDVRTVLEVVEALARHWGGKAEYRVESAGQPHEAGLLKLDCSKASRHLGWRPKMDLDRALALTVAWHKAWAHSANMTRLTREQLEEYQNL